MGSRALLVVVLLLVAACGGGRPGTPLELASQGSLPESWLDTIPSERGRCVPKGVSDGDTLTLAMEQPHPDQLAAVNPRDEWLYLVHDFRPSLLPPEEFARRDSLRLPVGATRAYVAVAGRDTLERVFRTPGRYRFVLTERLGTDVIQPIYHCFVEYRD